MIKIITLQNLSWKNYHLEIFTITGNPYPEFQQCIPIALSSSCQLVIDGHINTVPVAEIKYRAVIFWIWNFVYKTTEYRVDGKVKKNLMLDLIKIA